MWEIYWKYFGEYCQSYITLLWIWTMFYLGCILFWGFFYVIGWEVLSYAIIYSSHQWVTCMMLTCNCGVEGLSQGMWFLGALPTLWIVIIVRSAWEVPHPTSNCGARRNSFQLSKLKQTKNQNSPKSLSTFSLSDRIFFPNWHINDLI